MKRRTVLGTGLVLPLWATAHHGWSSFDQARPLWLEGRVSDVAWRNPHVELKLELSATMRLPTDLRTRRLPEQTAAVDGQALLAITALPKRTDRVWEVELAPLTRMQAWKVPEIKAGTDLAVLGFTFQGEQGKPVLRAEYLFLGGQIYGLRSSPA